MKGQHKVIVRVEIDGGATIASTEKEFSGGNPSFHASEFAKAVTEPVDRLKKALEGVFGIAPDERDTLERKKFIELADSINAAKKEGARVYRVVFLTESRITLTSEAMYLHQLETRWDEFTSAPGLKIDKIEYGVLDEGRLLDYEWHTL